MSQVVELKSAPINCTNFKTQSGTTSVASKRPKSALNKFKQHLLPDIGERSDDDSDGDDEACDVRLSSYRLTVEEVSQLPTLHRAVWKGKRQKVMRYLSKWENAKKINKLDQNGR